MRVYLSLTRSASFWLMKPRFLLYKFMHKLDEFRGSYTSHSWVSTKENTQTTVRLSDACLKGPEGLYSFTCGSLAKPPWSFADCSGVHARSAQQPHSQQTWMHRSYCILTERQHLNPLWLKRLAVPTPDKPRYSASPGEEWKLISGSMQYVCYCGTKQILPMEIETFSAATERRITIYSDPVHFHTNGVTMLPPIGRSRNQYYNRELH